MRKFIFYLLIISMIFSFLKPSLSITYSKRDDLRIHFDSIVIDSHNDTMMTVIDDKTWLPKVNIGKSTANHIDISKLKAGGLNVPFFAAYTSGYYGNDERSISRTLALINALYWTEKNNKDIFKIVRTVEEIEKIPKAGMIAAVPTIEGGYSFNEDNWIELLNQYHDLGIKVIGFTWNYSNKLGEGANRIYGDANKTPSSGGLTKLGAKLVLEMNKLGMVIDVSHMAESTFWDIINISKSPIIASHSGVYSLKNHQRNLTDEQMGALAKNGGVISIVFYPPFLTGKRIAYVKDLVDHIDYAVKIAGIDHVGIGSDFDGGGALNDLKDASEFYKITGELIKRGYSNGDIEKLLGKNILRVLKECEDNVEAVVIPNGISKGDLRIIPEFQMGQEIKDISLLIANIEGLNGSKIDEDRSRIIVDGIPYRPRYNKETSNLFLRMDKPLKEKFHVVTFEVWNDKGKNNRETRIFIGNEIRKDIFSFLFIGDRFQKNGILYEK